MIKLSGFMNRRDLMTREEFLDHYLNRHLKVSSALPGLLKYVGGPAIVSANGDDPPFDACSQLYWETAEEIQAIYHAADWDRSRDDMPNLISGRTMILTEEHELLDRLPEGGDPVKYLALLTRSDGMPREEFRRYWLEEHAPLALQTPGLLRYRACPSVSGVNDPIPAFDGIVEMWFESVEAFRESYRDPFWDRLRADYFSRFAMGRIQFLVREHPVLDRTAEGATT